MAARVSAWPPSAHWPTTSPGAGLADSETVPDAVRSPSIQCLAISLKYRLLRAAHWVSSYLMLQVVRRMA